MGVDSEDLLVRRAAFDRLNVLRDSFGDVLPRDELVRGFQFDGRQVAFLSQRGIFKPAILRTIPLSIYTAAPKPGRVPPYEDQLSDEGLLLYKYFQNDPQHRDNVGLRAAISTRTPIVYFYGITPGQYFATWPVYVVADDPGSLTFTIAMADPQVLGADLQPMVDPVLNRSYFQSVTTRRIHQGAFSKRVMAAYRRACAICRLKEAQLIDAAHILPDRHPRGEPIVQNGLALCKLHHAAFDANLFGIRPDRRIEVSARILGETDGPMLRHGLQEIHDANLVEPVSTDLRPRADLLEERFVLFQEAS